MRTLGNTLARLKAFKYPEGLALRPVTGPTGGRLTELRDFRPNPGALEAYAFVPDSPTALVVVLHGCTQSAAGYDQGSGWSELAERYGFALLFPQQTRANNANLCFNWFVAEDTRRGGGEASSIRTMIATMVERHSIDPERVFVTGLSAGGAMASTMLAAYPELFAGGAIIAGVPHGVASSVPQAFDRMRGHGLPDAGALEALVREASPHPGPWPKISVWHGTADATVSDSNADAIIAQWRQLNAVGATPDRTEEVHGTVHRSWLDDRGRPVIEDYRIPGMGHGTPIAVSGVDGLGQAMPFMLDVELSSTRVIAESWNLLGKQRVVHQELVASAPAVPAPISRITQKPRAEPGHAPCAQVTAPVSGIQRTIEAALRSAGLMR